MRTTVRCEAPRCEFDGSERASGGGGGGGGARGSAGERSGPPQHAWGRGGRRCHQEGTQSSLLVRVQSGVVRAFVRATMLNKTAAKTRGFIRVRGGRGGAFGRRGQTVDVDISRRSSVIMDDGRKAAASNPPGTGCSRLGLDCPGRRNAVQCPGQDGGGGGSGCWAGGRDEAGGGV